MFWQQQREVFQIIVSFVITGVITTFYCEDAQLTVFVVMTCFCLRTNLIIVV